MKLVIAIDLPDEHTPTDHGFLVGALNKLIKEKIPTAHWSFSTYSDQQAVDAWIEAFRQRGASR